MKMLCLPLPIGRKEVQMVIPLTPVRFFEYAEKIFRDKEGVVCGGRRFSYGDFCRRTRKISNALLKIGIRKGDRVAYLGYNCHRLLELFYAPPMLGAVLEPLNIRLATRDFEYILNESTPRVLFLDGDFIPVIDSIRERIPSVEHFLALEKGPGLPGWIRGSYEDLLSDASAERSYPLGEYPFAEEDPAEIFYTSGTTGKPKGVMMTHRNLYLHALCAMSMMAVRDTDVQIHLIPLFHVNGWGTPHYLLAKGGKHIMVKRFDPEKTLEIMGRERVTRAFVIPTMVSALMAVPNFHSFNLSALREILIGGAPPPRGMCARVEEAFGCIAHTGFGMTETCPLIVLPELSADLDAEEYRHRRHDTWGRPLPGVEFRLVDGQGRDLPWDGESVGELLVRGDMVMKGYFRQPEETDRALEGGWYHTGDLCALEPDGQLIVKDRKKDIIISGGENISSLEIEQVLYGHPAVLECAVIGKNDEKWGEVPLAFVVLREECRATPEELVRFMRDNLAHFKAPREVRILGEFPKGGTGKILKSVLREKYGDA
jgi:fatty-acyl-CoA synthase